MKIAAIEITDFKRIKHITLNPDADRAVVLIGGKNAQGKSSILDAITAAIGGKKESPTRPVREGAEAARIELQLDNGLCITRTFDPDGKAYLTVTSKEGAKFASPQKVLDEMTRGRFLDPLAFLHLDASAQRKLILEVADKDRRIPELDLKYKAAFERRTEANREVKRTTLQLEPLTERLKRPAPAMIDVSAIAAALETSIKSRGLLSDIETRLKNLDTTLTDLYLQRERLNDKIATVHAEKLDFSERLVVAREAVAQAGPSGNLHEQLASASALNREAAAYQQDEASAAALGAALGEAQDLAAKCELALVEIQKRKAKILADAQLGNGITINDDGVMLNGLPLEQASGAEQLRVALDLAMAANPELRDIWIKDGALLDDDHRAALEQLAQNADVRLWVEVVGEQPGSVVIVDGMVER
jgi:DNA repair exonuclease SbcCD ATPase subunit